MKFFIETYGCQMNFAESDSLHHLLTGQGYEAVSEPTMADYVLINTCSVRLTAEERIIGRIGYYRGLNQRSDHQIRVIVMGCMSENVGNELRKKFPDVVWMVWGTYKKQGIVGYLRDGRPVDHLGLHENYEFLPPEPQLKFDFKAYVPIAHGCNNFCSYCIVPYVRGPEIHRSEKDIMKDVEKLVGDGVLEINLLGQNVNSYRDGNIDFPDLLKRIAVETGVRRLTFLTSHPKDFSEKLVDTVYSHANIMRYIHLPFQAGSDRILTAMNRNYTAADYLHKIEWTRRIEDLSLTTDIMVGFPGETEEDFEATLRIVREVGFTEAYMYYYNPRPGTKAEKMDGAVPRAVKLERLDRLIKLQKQIGREKLTTHIGATLSVLGETLSKKDAHRVTGRSHNGLMVFFDGGKDYVGKIVDVKITAVSGGGLTGERLS